MIPGPGRFTEAEYQADARRVVEHALRCGRAEVVRADGSLRVVISVPPAEPPRGIIAG